MELNNFCAVAITDSLLVLLIGVLITFLVLSLLIIVVKIYSGLFKLLDMAKKQDKIVDKKDEPTLTVQQVVEVAQNDDELIAVITAAITAVYAQSTEDGEVPPFRVKSIFLK